MVAIIADRSLEDRLRAERERTGADRYDEVWEGVYVMNPLPDNEHQKLVHRFEMVFGELLVTGNIRSPKIPGLHLGSAEPPLLNVNLISAFSTGTPKSAASMSCSLNGRGAPVVNVAVHGG